MPSPALPAPALPHSPTTRIRTSELPVVRLPEPVECTAPLAVTVDGREPAVLRAVGEIDLLTVEQLRAALDQALAGARRTVVVDLRGVSFMDCAGIGLLVETRDRVRRRNLRLRILAGPAVARTVALLDLTAVLDLVVE
jgi:anti-sigma B factor antagonist